MKRILCFLISFSLMVSAYSANQWQEGTGQDTILGTISPSDIDKDSFENAIDPLDRMLTNYVEGCKIEYATASTITVGAGEVMLSNAAGTIKLMQQNTSATTVTWSDIDTGSEAASTTYYLYAYMDTVTTATFSVTISTSSSAPTGKTYYARLGSFYNDSSSNIDQDIIRNDSIWVERGSVITTSLKTSTSEVSHASNIRTLYTLTGGSYSFYPQTKMSSTAFASYASVGVDSNGSTAQDFTGFTSYTTRVTLKSDSGTIYAQNRYVTSSGQDYWIFILLDKNTKEIIGASAAPDHPSYGNGGDYNKLQHPFDDYDSSKHSIILIEKDSCNELRNEAKEKGISVLELINTEYKVDFTTVEKYKPLHSGRFIDKAPKLINNIPSYIKVKKAAKMTNAEKVSKEEKEESNRIKNEKKNKENKLIEDRMRKIARDQLVTKGIIE